MAFGTDDLIEGLRASRRHFLKHLKGLRDDQWDWRPNGECKSIRDTLPHLLADDRAALESLQSGGEPDYPARIEEALRDAGPERDVERVRALLDESHERLCAFIAERFGDAPPDTEVSAYGTPMKLGRAIAYLSSEDFYHAGQVAFIRIATDPSWDYYAVIYAHEGEG